MKKIILLAVTLFTTTAYFTQQGSTGIVDTEGRLTLETNANYNHDSTSCATNIDYMYSVVISNSTNIDTIKVVGMQGQILEQHINTPSTPNWYVNLSQFNVNFWSDDYIVNNFLDISDFTTPFVKVICGADTLYSQNTGMGIVANITNGCSYGTISGQVYLDNNVDCSFNTGDSAINNFNVKIQYGNQTRSGHTYNGGVYNTLVQESWISSYTVSLPSIYQFLFPASSCTPTSYTFATVPQTGIDFSLQCDSLDAEVNLHVNGAIRPAIPFVMTPSISNVGCEAVSGQLKLVIDNRATYSSGNSVNPPDVVVGDTLIWNYTNLTNVSNGGYWNALIGNIELTPTLAVNIGDTLCYEVITAVHVNDIDSVNNHKTFCYPVVNSYDPNIKEVFPKGLGQEGFISANTSKLKYKIHFQNTGNAPAINVHIIDTLLGNVIPSSLRVLESSHTMIPEWKSANVIDFKFNQIMLLDSTTNEPLSHGFVTFEIDMVQGLAPETEIKNKAEIYFDTNPPIITNYALNTIETISTSIGELAGVKPSVNVYPNPMHDFVVFDFSQLKHSEKAELSIFDISGKRILMRYVDGEKSIKLTNTELVSGVYIYHVTGNKTNNKTVGKLIVQ